MRVNLNKLFIALGSVYLLIASSIVTAAQQACPTNLSYVQTGDTYTIITPNGYIPLGIYHLPYTCSSQPNPVFQSANLYDVNTGATSPACTYYDDSCNTNYKYNSKQGAYSYSGPWVPTDQMCASSSNDGGIIDVTACPFTVNGVAQTCPTYASFIAAYIGGASPSVIECDYAQALPGTGQYALTINGATPTTASSLWVTWNVECTASAPDCLVTPPPT